MAKRNLQEKLGFFYFLYSWWHKATRPFREIKWFIHRGIYGWSDRDLWSFDSYIFRVFSTALPRFKAVTIGNPCIEDNVPKQCETCDCDDKFQAELAKGAELFKELANSQFEWKNWEEEEKVFQEAAEWFKKNIRSVWD